MFKPIVFIIVRTKNESHWEGKCLHAIKKSKLLRNILRTWLNITKETQS